MVSAARFLAVLLVRLSRPGGGQTRSGKPRTGRWDVHGCYLREGSSGVGKGGSAGSRLPSHAVRRLNRVREGVLCM